MKDHPWLHVMLVISPAALSNAQKMETFRKMIPQQCSPDFVFHQELSIPNDAVRSSSKTNVCLYICCIYSG